MTRYFRSRNSGFPGSWRLVSAMAAVSLLVIIGLARGATDATAAACQASSPPSGAYTVQVCFVDPAGGDTLTGIENVDVAITVTGSNPSSVQRVRFYLDGEYVLTDYNAGYAFKLPTAHWVDGLRTLQVEAVMRDGYTTSPRASIPVTFDNGVTTPPVNTNQFSPSTGTTPAPGHPFVAGAVGDGPDGSANAQQVTDVINSWNPNLFLFLGDVYEKGTPTEFHNWYGSTPQELWARFKPFTNPVIGNHEYENGVAPGYFDYWDNIEDYYSYEAAGWHLIALNSNSQLNGTQPGTPQYDWLAQDLGGHDASCTIVYFHHPVLSVGPQGDTTRMNAIWELLAQHDVELVITGHDHGYQRWHPLNGLMTPDPFGITQFVVGSGGHGIQAFVRSDNRLAVGFDTSPAAFGALRLELNAQGAAYRFDDKQGATLDSGSVQCGGTPADTIAPAAPSSLSADASSGTSVTLTWVGPIDNVGVTGYEIYRDGTLLTTTGAGTTFADTGVVPGQHSYFVKARDAAGNVSGPSNTASAGAAARLFVDNFESGTLANWTSNGLVVQQQEVFAGDFAARATSTGSAAWAWASVPAHNELFFRMRFKRISQGANSVYLQKFRTGTGSSLFGLSVGSTGLLGYRNDVVGQSKTSSTVVTTGAWHEVQVRLRVDGANGQTEVWLDGARIDALSNTESLGTSPIGRVQVGENSPGRTFDVAFDDIVVDTVFIDDPAPPDAEAPTSPSGLAATQVTASSVDLSWSASTDNVAVTGYTVYRGPQGGDPEDVQEIGTVDGTTLAYQDATVAPGTAYTYTVDAFDAAGNHSALSNAVDVTTPAPPSVLVFNPEADAYVRSSSAGSNYGSSTSLRVDASPDTRSYLRFTVQGAIGTVTSATLRVYANSSSSTGHLVRDVADDSWQEGTITYSNAPALGNVVGSSGSFSAGGYVDVDVTSLITGNGTYSLALTTTSNSSISYASDESATNRPELVLNFGP